MKKLLLMLGGCVVALVIATVIFILTFDINSYKPRIEAAASEAIGMKIHLNGTMKLTLFPRAGLSLEDILIQNNSANVASAKEVAVGISLLPLLRREVVIQQIGLITPTFFITQYRSGRYNVETPEKKPSGKEAPAGHLKMEKIFIKGGHLLYLDETSGKKTEASGCDLEIKNLSGGDGEFPDTLSFDGDLSCGQVTAEELRISDIDVIMKAREGKFEADPVTMNIFGGDGKGNIKGAMTGESPEYSVDFAIAKLRFEEVLGQFKQKKSTSGELDLKSHLTMKGKSSDEITGSVQGELSFQGQNLFHEGIDLDLILEKYENSQNFNLVDVGAFFVAGPLGTLLTKGYNFGSVFEKSLGGKSTILKLVSAWKIKNGIAEAEDVALSTKESRVALKGRLDFINEQFDNVTVAVLDEKGCVRFSQKIYGPFRDPRIEKVSTLSSIGGSVLNLFEKTKDLFTGGECEIFYAGSVKHPE